MADDKTAEAVDIVAHHVIANIVGRAEDTWEWYPELGEYDWQAIDERITAIIMNMMPDKIGFEAAYEYLERRAEQ